ncbi:MAG: hypothetical protein ACHQ9S_19335 [Candidatus Binatia bacterium]
MLFWLAVLHFYYKQDTYAGAAECLLVFVIAVEGLVAISALNDDRRNATAAANAAVFDLYKTYLSREYHQNVRRPAWYCVTKAKADPMYRKEILAGLAGAADDVKDAYESLREGAEPSIEDAERLRIHDEYHRLQDILGFFAMLCALSSAADDDIVRTCDFFYDRWRVQLHTLVNMLERYDQSEAGDQAADFHHRRCESFSRTLKALDKLFGFDSDKFDWRKDPLFKISDTADGADARRIKSA